MGEDGDEGSACDSTVSEEISDRGQGGVEERGGPKTETITQTLQIRYVPSDPKLKQKYLLH
jgi:hypothetical protein